MRLGTAALAVLVGSLFLVACGSDDATPTDNATTAAPTPTLSPSKHVDRPPDGEPPSSGNGAITLESPVAGAAVTSPVKISGTADVFEATVSIRILDAGGNEIARTFTTATCGTGCRGDYKQSVEFQVDAEQEGTIEVFEESAEDGSAINVVSVRVTLVP